MTVLVATLHLVEPGKTKKANKGKSKKKSSNCDSIISKLNKCIKKKGYQLDKCLNSHVFTKTKQAESPLKKKHLKKCKAWEERLLEKCNCMIIEPDTTENEFQFEAPKKQYDFAGPPNRTPAPFMQGPTFFLENVHSFSEPEDGIADIHCIFGTGASYRGHQNTTVAGIPCQNWNKQEPHRHSLLETYPGLAKAENYCRNPDRIPSGPWCFTTDPSVEFQSCDVPLCNDPTDPENRMYTCSEHGGLNYKGNITKTVSGALCSNLLVKEYKLLNCVKGNGVNYGGENSMPEEGDGFCVPWYIDNPQMYPYNLYMGYNNYCRNPDGSAEPWCFRWSGMDLVRSSCNMVSCKGILPVERKVTRLNVCSRSVHDEALPEGPWCYTRKGKKERCDVPTCELRR